ncbi:Ger(x)C family spore germination protein [Paenibacillus sp. NPDC056579]|uniref:Ger(x)C family spore germination protein n=1 Tax=unclassified Paenibacillus TaxID=185978 RepID=UPI001EF86E0C|nr:Ger(x)C family spore germination protein [Paenibacillus sp. H1-7]ULL17210.1 Ger(x)C family spore germination protein [Paenibacillus sp. H1-7]
MRTKRSLFIGLVFSIMTLSGCWDVSYLTNKKMVTGIGMDAAPNGQITGTVRAAVLKSRGAGQFDIKDEMIQATGDSVNRVGDRIDGMLPGTIDVSKTHVIIIGEELAKRGIFAPLESFYRSRKAYLNGNIIISKGLASEVISAELTESNPVSFDIKQMILGATYKSIVPKQTLYTLWMNTLPDEAADAVMPVIRKIEKNHLIIDTTGLFHGDKFTGVTLAREESCMLMLMMDKLSKLAYLSIPVKSDEAGQRKDTMSNIISFEVRAMKRAFDVSVKPNTEAIQCILKLDLYGEVRSSPTSIGREIDRKALEEELNASLGQRAKDVAGKLKQANSDVLGIGRRLRAHHNEMWKRLDWNEKFKEVVMNPEVNVHIQSTGILK